MDKKAWAAVWGVTALLSFLVGVSIGRTRSQKTLPTGDEMPRITRSGGQDDLRPYIDSLEEFRLALAGKEMEIRHLQDELADLRGEPPSSLSSEEERKEDEQEEARVRAEGLRARYAASKELQKKILQRKDKALRTEGLAELAALLQSEDSEQILLGLSVLPRINFIQFDKEAFAAHVLSGTTHEDPEVRRASLLNLGSLCPKETVLDLAFSMVNDPSLRVRQAVVDHLSRAKGDYRKEEVSKLLFDLIQDEDKYVRTRALRGLGERTEYAGELEDLAIEWSRIPEYQEEMIQWLGSRRTVTARTAERMIEAYEEGQTEYHRLDWTRRSMAEDARPLALEFCLKVLVDSTEPYQRWRALDSLRRIGDASVIPRLEAIAAGDDAEGIETRLKTTIDYIRRNANRQR